MLTVLLKILSVVGILLLIILGILLALFLLVLFVPIRYRVQASRTAEDYEITAKASWLLGAVRGMAAFPNPGNATFHVLVFKLFDLKRQKDGKADLAEENVTPKPEGHTQDSDINSSHAREEEPDFDGLDETGGNPSISDEEEESGERQPIQEKISSKFEKFQYKVKKIYGRIKDVSSEAEFYKKLVEDEKTGLLLGHVFYRLKKVLRVVRPRKLKADIVFGAQTPDVTGYAYGIYCAMAPFLGKYTSFVPDFTEARLEGRLYAKGRITVFLLLMNGWAVFFDRNLKIFRRRLKKHSEQRGKRP